MLLLIGQAGRFVEGEILHVPPALRLFTRETPYLDSLFFVATCLIAFVLSPLVEILCPVPGHPWTWWHFATSSGFIFALFWVSALVVSELFLVPFNNKKAEFWMVVSSGIVVARPS